MKDPETPGVTVEVIGTDDFDDSTYKLEVKIETDKIDEVPEQMTEYINEKEEIALVYDVKLWKITNEGGVEKKELIQPTQIEGATSIVVNMEIPDEIKGKTFRLYHIHNDNEHYNKSGKRHKGCDLFFIAFFKNIVDNRANNPHACYFKNYLYPHIPLIMLR